jgi:putative glutamine transport system substrate-binding protein
MHGALRTRTAVVLFSLAFGLVGGWATPAVSAEPAKEAKFPASSYMAKIMERGKLIVGTKYDVPMFSYLDPKTGQVEGFDVDFAKEFSKALFGDPGKIEFKEVVSRTRIPMLQEGMVDIVVASMTITKERMQQIDFSDVYFESGNTILVADKSPIQKLEDLRGKTITATKGSTSGARVGAWFPTAKILFFDTPADNFEALKTGRADAMIQDETIERGMMSKAPGFRLLPGRMTYEPYGVGIRKGHLEFVEFLNKVINDVKASGRWKEIWKRNLGGDAPEPPGKLDVSKLE